MSGKKRKSIVCFQRQRRVHKPSARRTRARAKQQQRLELPVPMPIRCRTVALLIRLQALSGSRPSAARFVTPAYAEAGSHLPGSREARSFPEFPSLPTYLPPPQRPSLRESSSLREIWATRAVPMSSAPPFPGMAMASTSLPLVSHLACPISVFPRCRQAQPPRISIPSSRTAGRVPKSASLRKPLSS